MKKYHVCLISLLILFCLPFSKGINAQDLSEIDGFYQNENTNSILLGFNIQEDQLSLVINSKAKLEKASNDPYLQDLLDWRNRIVNQAGMGLLDPSEEDSEEDLEKSILPRLEFSDYGLAPRVQITFSPVNYQFEDEELIIYFEDKAIYRLKVHDGDKLVGLNETIFEKVE